MNELEGGPVKMVMLNGNKDMFTPTEVAQLLNVHINTVRRWSNMGILKSYRIGPRGDRRFSRDDLERFLNGTSGANIQVIEKLSLESSAGN